MRIIGYVLLNDTGAPVRKSRKAGWDRKATTAPAALYETPEAAAREQKRYGGTVTKVFAR